MSARELDRSGWEQEGPDQYVRIVELSTRVLAGAMCFFFGGFFFAFVYVRLQNVNDHWNHADAKPSMPLALAVLVATLLAAIVPLTIRGRHRAHEPGSWRTRGRLIELLIVIAIVARIIQLWTLGLDPSSGGYVAVLIGWGGSLVAVTIGGLYWVQTLVARAGRLARTAQDDGAQAGRQELADAGVRFHASASGFTLWWCVVAAVEIVAFLLLDVVR